jgi:opacity protein-like surface antigen
MRIRIFALALGAAVALSLSSVAPAQEDTEPEPPYDRSAAYIIAQGANHIGTFRGKPASNISTTTRHSMGAKGAIGYRISPHFAGEIQFDWVQKFRVRVDGDRKRFNGAGITAQVKGYALTGKVQPFGVLGLGVGLFEIRHDKRTKYKKTQAEMMLRFGGGVDYWFTDQFGMVVDATYAWPTGATNKLEDLDYATIGWGFMIRFGGD